MEIEVQSYKRVDLVKASGRVDSNNAHELEQAFQQLGRTGRYQLVVDLSGIDYMSSAGLRALVAALRESKRHNGDLVIASPSARMREVLTLAGLDSVFSIYDDTIAAVGDL
jgi:anti-sigma B factor antagonist